MPASDELHRIRDHLAGDEGSLHPFRAHRHAIGDGDGVELLGSAARRAYALFDVPCQIALIEVTGHRLDPAVRHADDGPLEILIIEAGAFEHRPGPGTIVAVQDDAALVAHVERRFLLGGWPLSGRAHAYPLPSSPFPRPRILSRSWRTDAREWHVTAVDVKRTRRSVAKVSLRRYLRASLSTKESRSQAGEAGWPATDVGESPSSAIACAASTRICVSSSRRASGSFVSARKRRISSSSVL